MSIPSFYGSGPDEEELFRLTDPSTHPEASDEATAMQEVEWLSSSDYADNQEEFDERESGPENLTETLPPLSPDELESVLKFIDRLRGTG